MFESLALSQEEREDSYQQAVAAFAQVMSVPVPETKRRDFGAPHYERILLLHMSALLDVADEPDSIGEQEEDERNQIVGRVLDREIRFWERLLLSRELDASLRKGLDGAMAAFTLIDGVWTKEEAIDLLQRLPFFEDEKWRILEAVAELLHDSYGGDEKYIESLQPDLLGEYLIGRG